MFQNKIEIENLIKQTDNRHETEKIVAKLKFLKSTRNPFYLKIEEFEEILKWKLRNQLDRQRKIRLKNTEKNINIVTKTAFMLNHKNPEVEIELKLKTLTLIYGVHIPVASSILTLCYPERYSVIDYRNWRQIFKSKTKKTNYSTKDYILYLKHIQNYATKFNCTTQQIDIAIWQKDKNEFG